jgi:hypothetical protein
MVRAIFLASFWIISGPISATHYFSRSPAVAELFSTDEDESPARALASENANRRVSTHLMSQVARMVATKADKTISNPLLTVCISLQLLILSRLNLPFSLEKIEAVASPAAHRPAPPPSMD